MKTPRLRKRVHFDHGEEGDFDDDAVNLVSDYSEGESEEDEDAFFYTKAEEGEEEEEENEECDQGLVGHNRENTLPIEDDLSEIAKDTKSNHPLIQVQGKYLEAVAGVLQVNTFVRRAQLSVALLTA